MSTPAQQDLPFSTRPIRPETAASLRKLQPGQKVRITQTVRVGSRSWTAVVTGTFRHLGSLATGISTNRVPEDDIIVPTIHLCKDNQELSCLTVDENTRIEILE